MKIKWNLTKVLLAIFTVFLAIAWLDRGDSESAAVSQPVPSTETDNEPALGGLSEVIAWLYEIAKFILNTAIFFINLIQFLWAYRFWFALLVLIVLVTWVVMAVAISGTDAWMQARWKYFRLEWGPWFQLKYIQRTGTAGPHPRYDGPRLRVAKVIWGFFPFAPGARSAVFGDFVDQVQERAWAAYRQQHIHVEYNDWFNHWLAFTHDYVDRVIAHFQMYGRDAKKMVVEYIAAHHIDVVGDRYTKTRRGKIKRNEWWYQVARECLQVYCDCHVCQPLKQQGAWCQCEEHRMRNFRRNWRANHGDLFVFVRANYAGDDSTLYRFDVPDINEVHVAMGMHTKDRKVCLRACLQALIDRGKYSFASDSEVGSNPVVDWAGLEEFSCGECEVCKHYQKEANHAPA